MAQPNLNENLQVHKVFLAYLQILASGERLEGIGPTSRFRQARSFACLMNKKKYIVEAPGSTCSSNKGLP